MSELNEDEQNLLDFIKRKLTIGNFDQKIGKSDVDRWVSFVKGQFEFTVFCHKYLYNENGEVRSDYSELRFKPFDVVRLTIHKPEFYNGMELSDVLQTEIGEHILKLENDPREINNAKREKRRNEISNNFYSIFKVG